MYQIRPGARLESRAPGLRCMVQVGPAPETSFRRLRTGRSEGAKTRKLQNLQGNLYFHRQLTVAKGVGKNFPVMLTGNHY